MNKPNKVGFNELNERQLKDVEAGGIYENIFRKVKEFSNSGDTEGFREYMTNLRELLGEDTFNQIFTKRGPLEEGDENRAKLLESMYGGNRKINSGGNKVGEIFKPTRLVFPEKKGFYFRDGEVEKEIQFEGGTLPERFVEVLKNNPGCMAFTICSIDVDTETKKLDSILRSIEDRTGRVHLGTSTNGEDLHVILGDDKYRDLGYRKTIAELVEGSDLYNLSCGNKDLGYKEEKPTLDEALKGCKKALNGNNVFRDITNKYIREFFGIEEPEKEKTKTKRMSL